MSNLRTQITLSILTVYKYILALEMLCNLGIQKVGIGSFKGCVLFIDMRQVFVTCVTAKIVDKNLFFWLK